MNAPEKCAVEGKSVFPDRDSAKAYAKSKQQEWHGRGKAYRCTFGDHYHVTRSRMGRSCTKGGK